MRKLYLKIVVAIWVVMICSSIGSVWVLNLTRSDSERPGPRSSMPERFLLPVLEEVLSETTSPGDDALVQAFTLSGLAERGVPITLQNEAGQFIFVTGRTDDVEALKTQNKGAGTWRYEFEHLSGTYVLTAAAPNRPPRFGNFWPITKRSPWIIFLIAIPLSVLLSILIARYLIKPLSALEAASLRLAGGDLRARVGPSVTRRGDEIAHFATTFDLMANQIESLVEAHKTLLRDVSHELRSPLARMQAALSLASQRTGNNVSPEFSRIEIEIERLNGMIGMLLDFSKLDLGQWSGEMESVNVNDMLEELVTDSNIEAKVQHKFVNLESSLHFHAMADARVLASCFENIIRNAIRHTPSDSAIDIAMYSHESGSDRFVVDVRDRGPGVAESELAKIFDPFYKPLASSEATSDGAGIGLAIAKKAVEIHGGQITARNASGGGLIVSVELPVASDARNS